jgi:hypothetical protein
MFAIVNKVKFVSLGLAVGLFAAAGVLAQTDPNALAKKFMPKDARLMHEIVDGRFGPGENNLVVLFGEDEEAKAYQGFVLIPRGEKYEKAVLPTPNVAYAIEEPKSVFYADVDRDGKPELLIIAECYTGIGPEGSVPFYRTRVYEWKGENFVHMEKVSETIGNSPTANTAKRKLAIR